MQRSLSDSSVMNQDKAKLQTILNDINAKIEASDDDSGYIYPADFSESKDAELAATKINLAAPRLTKNNGYFRVFLATDFNQWEVEKIKDLAIFFSLFGDSRVVLVIDAQQLAGLEEKKFEAFIVAAQKAAGLAEIYTADFSNNLASYLPKERAAFVKETLPSVDFIYRDKASNKKESLLHSFISIQPIMSFLLQKKQTSINSAEQKASINKSLNSHHFWKPVIIGAVVGAVGALCALSLKRK